MIRPHYHRHWHWKLPLPLQHQLPMQQPRKILHSQILQPRPLKRRHPLLQLLLLRHCRLPPLQLMMHQMQLQPLLQHLLQLQPLLQHLLQLQPLLQHLLQLQPKRMTIPYHRNYHHYRHYLRNLNLMPRCHYYHLRFLKILMLQQKMKNHYCRHRHHGYPYHYHRLNLQHQMKY
jgi:hypothetical protein